MDLNSLTAVRGHSSHPLASSSLESRQTAPQSCTTRRPSQTIRDRAPSSRTAAASTTDPLNGLSVMARPRGSKLLRPVSRDDVRPSPPPTREPASIPPCLHPRATLGATDSQQEESRTPSQPGSHGAPRSLPAVALPWEKGLCHSMPLSVMTTLTRLQTSPSPQSRRSTSSTLAVLETETQPQAPPSTSRAVREGLPTTPSARDVTIQTSLRGPTWSVPAPPAVETRVSSTSHLA